MQLSGRNVVVTGAGRGIGEALAWGFQAERFFVLPHPEVADDMALEATDPERWLGGRRKLQRRTIGA